MESKHCAKAVLKLGNTAQANQNLRSNSKQRKHSRGILLINHYGPINISFLNVISLHEQWPPQRSTHSPHAASNLVSRSATHQAPLSCNPLVKGSEDGLDGALDKELLHIGHPSTTTTTAMMLKGWLHCWNQQKKQVPFDQTKADTEPTTGRK